MALVIQQTLPYEPSTLKLTEPTRWTTLLPLIRPAIKISQTRDQHAIFLDTSLLAGHEIPLAVIYNSAGDFSGEILRSGTVAALSFGGSEVSAEDVCNELEKENGTGIGIERGVLILRLSSADRGGRVQVGKEGSNVVLVDVFGALQFDHVLSLLATANSGTRYGIIPPPPPWECVEPWTF